MLRQDQGRPRPLPAPREATVLSISLLARRFGLSRSTLLYYDRIGLLRASTRSGAAYRLYSEADARRLESICTYRDAGLSLAEIAAVLASDGRANAVLRARLDALGARIHELQQAQRMLAGLISATAGGCPPVFVDKRAFVQILEAAGVGARARDRWHAEFERRAPRAHHAFLLSLGIGEEEARMIRARSARQAKRPARPGANGA